MTTQSGEFSLEAKYTQERGRIFLSGIQALVRLPLDQHRADLRRGLNTATFISGYRGSPLGRLRPDPRAPVGAAQGQRRGLLLGPQRGPRRDRGVRQPDGGPLPEAQVRRRARHVVRQGPGRRPHRRRSSSTPTTRGWARTAACSRWPGTIHSRSLRRCRAHSEVALYDALMPTLFPGNVQEILDLGLHGFMLSAYSGLWVGGQDRHQRGRRDRHRRGRSPERVSPIIPMVELDGKPFQHQINVNLIPPYGLDMERTHPRGAPRAGPALRVREQAQPDHGADARTRGSASSPAARPTTTSARPSPSSASTRPRCAATASASSRWACCSRWSRGSVREFARGLAGDPRRRGEAVVPRDVLQGHPLRHDRPAAGGGQARRGGPAAAAAGRRARLGPDRPRDRPRLARRIRIDSVEARIQHLDELKRRPEAVHPGRARAFFCSGCPHNRSTVVPEGSVAAAGIGCHGMAMGMDRGIIGVTHMGARGRAVGRRRALHRDDAPLPEHRRRHVLPLGRPRAQLRGRLGRQHHLQDPLQRARWR